MSNKTRTRSLIRACRAAAAALIFASVAAPVLAAGGGGGGSGGAGGGGSGPILPCPRGQIRDGTGSCVDKSSQLLDDESRYAYGAFLAQSGRYSEAIDALSLAENKDDPRILNYLGYAHRQQGRFDVGLGYYRQALKVDPDFVLAREYMGEAFLALGEVGLAREQLGEIATRCGTDCMEYKLLAEAIADHEAALKRRS